jgi:ribosome maturation factor RimP
MDGRERELHDLLEPEIASQGVDLLEVSLAPAGSRVVVRIVIHSAAGVSHGDCARVTRIAAEKLDEREAVPGSYILEVSSPGTDRVLKSEREFDVFRGRRVRLWRDVEGTPTETAGVCAGTRENGLVVLRSDDGEESTIPWSSVTKARLVPDEAGFREAGGRKR